MEREVQQLVEMGATVAQARAALRQHKDVMQAAEKIFEGSFDHIVEDEPGREVNLSKMTKGTSRMITPDEADQDIDLEEDEGDDYLDYDSDYELPGKSPQNTTSVDPYAGIFFSKDRREEVIEVEEDPELYTIPGTSTIVKIMTQGQWMKGCPEGGEQSFLFSLYDQVSNGSCSCPDCKHPHERRKSDFFALYPKFEDYISNLQGIISKRCSKCPTEFCFACGERMSTERATRQDATAPNDVLFHCSNIQGIILGVGLSMLEQLFTEQGQDASPLSTPPSKATKKRKARESMVDDMDEDEDSHYGSISMRGKKSKGGTGYAGAAKEDTSGQIEALAAQRSKDERIATLLNNIRVYLPSIQRAGGGRTSDYLVHPTTLAHLRRRFNFVSSSLLRNDSLTDMSDRYVLYFELFDWLETISNHEALASMMAMPIMVPVLVKSMTTRKGGNNRTARERTIIYEGSSGPRELLEAIVLQAQAALKGLDSTKANPLVTKEMTEEEKRITNDDKGKAKLSEPAQTPENQKLEMFCNRILATAKSIDRSLRETKGDVFVDRLHASLPRIPTASASVENVKAGNSDEETRKVYVEWATRARFEYCDLSIPATNKSNGQEDQAPSYKFHFSTEARLLANADIPKRSLAIAKELAVLTTNLPVAWDSSVFLRVDETRVDIIKCLIIGPEGTPYQNGCFLFDIFLGPNYNQVPPSVKYMTTGGGKYRFNPNLYADGKVCLSLLGTWSGPGWVAGKSTLLQVLISIQSMILCEEPYLNEPGWSSSGGTPQSLAYSANVRRMVVNTAMLDMLKNPPEPFKPVIHTHFRLKAKPIREQLDRWLAQDDGKATAGDGGYSHVHPVSKKNKESGGSGSSSAFAKDVNELKSLLDALEKGETKDGESMDIDS